MYVIFYGDFTKLDHFDMTFCLSAIETNLAIVCACAPTLRGLVRSWFPRALVKTADESGTGDGISTEMQCASTGGPGDSILESRRRGSVQSGSYRHSNNSIIDGDGGNAGRFGSGKDDREAHAEGRLGPCPSEEDMMAYSGILVTTNMVLRPDSDQGSDGEGSARHL